MIFTFSIIINAFIVFQEIYVYTTTHAEEFLKEKWEDKEIKEAVKLLKDEELDVEKSIAILKELTEANSNNAGLAKLRALICKKGFDSGELKTE